MRKQNLANQWPVTSKTRTPLIIAVRDYGPVATSHGLLQLAISLCLLLVFSAALPLAGVFAQGPLILQDPNSAPQREASSELGWQARYWNNTSLVGTPVVTRQETSLDFNWGPGSPDPRVQADQFSARWERYIHLTPGTYRFTAISDDGVRVWVNDRLIIDNWRQQAATRSENSLFLAEGHHLVKVEYFEFSGGASISVSWQKSSEIFPWKGEYFNNKSLHGTPQLVRYDANINFNWRYDSPAVGLNPDGFSVRWSRHVALPAGYYRFTASVDDGVRLFINGHILIDSWQVQGVTDHSGIIYLPSGPVTVQMEYYEETGWAEAHLTWQKLDEAPAPTPTNTPPATPTPTPPPPPAVWQAQFWNNRFLSGPPLLVQQVSIIDYNWETNSPSPSLINQDNFSARWTGSFVVSSGYYFFEVTADDGVRLYVNNRLVIDAWQDQVPTTYRATVPHPGGPLEIFLEYYEHTEHAQVRLLWRPTTGPTPAPILRPSPLPTPTPHSNIVVVDNLQSGFRRGGLEAGWRQASEGYENHLFWTKNNDKRYPAYNWGRWYPALDDAEYEVFVYIPHRYTTTTNARYWISHVDGFTQKTVDQSLYSNQWVSLGTYRFQGTEQDYVSLADVTSEERLSRLIAWDAMRWERR